MSTFSNCILIVVFNFSDCTNNKGALERIYGKHFKKIIFYSDYPYKGGVEGVHYININRGYNTHAVFAHVYEMYKAELDACDGLFYTMDDNIINVNILNLYTTDKIIHDYKEIKPLNEYSGWWWDTNDPRYGKIAILKMMDDDECKPHGIDKFSGTYADWFFLPKRYLTHKTFDLFRLFAKHEVFLELAIPSVLHNIEQDKRHYLEYTYECLWDEDRQKFSDKSYVQESLNKRHTLILHPIKFNQNRNSVGWLEEFFCKEKCIIITTINSPSETVLKHIKNPEYDVIIVGDNKTPADEYTKLNCIYLGVDAQNKLFPELSEMIPYDHYCRKNLGYLYAIKKGYKTIYETDDDNIPYDNFDSLPECRTMISEESNRWINIFKHFTGNAYIWPRGYPLSLLKTNPNHAITDTVKTPSITNGLVENDPDVDALFRIVCTHQSGIRWDTSKHALIDNKNVCPFNTQNTFWLNPAIFACMLIPCSVSFRYCDILRGIIANVILKKTGNYMSYTSPNVVQKRNEHNLISDFKSEYDMYIHNESIVEYIEEGTEGLTDIKELLRVVYSNLLTHKVITEQDARILTKWLSYF